MLTNDTVSRDQFERELQIHIDRHRREKERADRAEAALLEVKAWLEQGVQDVNVRLGDGG